MKGDVKGELRAYVGNSPRNDRTERQVSANKSFATAMTRLEETDPDSYRAIQTKLRQLKYEAMNWRLQAQGKTSHGETLQAANYEEKVPQQ